MNSKKAAGPLKATCRLLFAPTHVNAHPQSVPVPWVSPPEGMGIMWIPLQ